MTCLVCSRDDSATTGNTVRKPVPTQVISNFSITETTMGRKDWVLSARKAYIYEDRNLLEAEDVKIDFFDERGEVGSTLTATYGKINRTTNDMEARGNVVVTSAKGITLKTESLTWNSRTRTIASDDSVTVTRHDDILTGWGFRGNPDLSSFEILRNMRARIRNAGEIEDDTQRGQ